MQLIRGLRAARIRWFLLAWLAVVLLFSTPLLVGWITTREHADTALVVGLRDEGTQLDIAEQVRRETGFSGPILVVVEAPCTPPEWCPPAAYYQSFGEWEAGDGSVAIGPNGDRLYSVTITRRDFGWWPAFATAFLIPPVLALVYAVAEWVRVRRAGSGARRTAGERGLPPGGWRGPAIDGRPSSGPQPRPTPWPHNPHPVNPPPQARAVSADVPATRAERTADLPVAPVPPEAPHVVPVHVDASGLSEIAQLYAVVGTRGTARTHIDATGGYAEFAEFVLWVDNARPDSATGVPGDAVQVVPLPRDGFRR
ncbi:hypothetical protein [Nocardia barduliensis]|uniref:hypothetical protein n=1 Tax=Nocardia barduliensis TaxID=2736643 RepID=UPI0015734D99|nr:hypothetical protein [Nocardia barduliensis]